MTQRRLSPTHSLRTQTFLASLLLEMPPPPAIPTFQAVPTGDRTHNTKRYNEPSTVAIVLILLATLGVAARRGATAADRSARLN